MPPPILGTLDGSARGSVCQPRTTVSAKAAGRLPDRSNLLAGQAFPVPTPLRSASLTAASTSALDNPGCSFVARPSTSICTCASVSVTGARWPSAMTVFISRSAREPGGGELFPRASGAAYHQSRRLLVSASTSPIVLPRLAAPTTGSVCSISSPRIKDRNRDSGTFTALWSTLNPLSGCASVYCHTSGVTPPYGAQPGPLSE